MGGMRWWWIPIIGLLLAATSCGSVVSSTNLSTARPGASSASPTPFVIPSPASPTRDTRPLALNTRAIALLATPADVDKSLTPDLVRGLSATELRAYGAFFGPDAPGPGFRDAAVSQFHPADYPAASATPPDTWVVSFALVYSTTAEAHDAARAVLNHMFTSPPEMKSIIGDESLLNPGVNAETRTPEVLSVWRERNLVGIVFAHGSAADVNWASLPTIAMERRFSAAT